MRCSTLVKKIANSVGLYLSRTNHPGVRYLDLLPSVGLNYALHRAFSRLENLCFVQVGANDGQRNDPIAGLIQRFNWHGTLIEPRMEYFSKLQNLHGKNPALRIVQAAIADRQSVMPLFYIDPTEPNLPDFAGGLSTLDRSRIDEACRDLGLPPSAILQEEIRALRWQDLDPETPLSKTNVLVIDTEGLDITLLRLWDWNQSLPSVVHFEHACAQSDDYYSFIRKIRGYGYEIVTEGGDTTAFLPSHLKSATS